MIAIAIVMSVTMELIRLSRGLWLNTKDAPLVPRIPVSWVPVPQLIILIPLSFWLNRISPLTLHDLVETDAQPTFKSVQGLDPLFFLIILKF